MSKHIDSNQDMDQLDDFIDQAIDELFVPASARKAAEEAPAEEPAQAEASEPEAAEELDLSISWDQGSEEEGGGEEDPALETVEVEDWSAEARAADEEGREAAEVEVELDEPVGEVGEQADDEQEDDGREEWMANNPVLQNLNEAMLSLDWEVNQGNISTFESALNAFQGLHPGVHVDTVARMGVITCKYLKASKSLATPLALKFLKEMLQAFDVFLAPAGTTAVAPDALVNNLMGSYNEMKQDANRLRATAIARRAPLRAASPQPAAQDHSAPAAPTHPAAPAPPGDPAVVIREGLGKLWDRLENIRARLHGAASQGAPFAEAIDTACSQMQDQLRSVMGVSEGLKKGSVTVDPQLRDAAQQLSVALNNFLKLL